MVDQFPKWTTKLITRILQMSHKPGEYFFKITVCEDGRVELTLYTTVKTEQLDI